MIGGAILGWLIRNWPGLAVGLIGMALVSAAAFVFPRRAPPPVVVQQAASRPTASPQPLNQIVVHVSGEVTNPGVYSLKLGARIDDAVRAAGGLTDKADARRLNLAARLADGQQLVVYRIPDATASPGAAPHAALAGRLSLSTASVAELDQLPGVGPVTAQRIVAYREKHGPFTRIEQLREAKLVNQSTFEKIRELVEP
ncbi:MAG: ComEA family DNA-binding protein [Chloroflexi bacterium]|nr:ComEA family DNA-binding protein [Chloroflexota bacterium]